MRMRELGASAASMDDRTARRLQHAMLSVYYASTARQLTVSGAPSVLVPAAQPPLPLAEALDILQRDASGDHARLAAAIWLLVRSSPIPAKGDSPRTGMPPELGKYLKNSYGELASLRREARKDAAIVGAALVATKEEDSEALKILLPLAIGRCSQFTSGLSLLLRDSVGDGDVARRRGRKSRSARAADHVALLERQTGLSIDRFVRHLAEADAFSRFTQEHMDGLSPDGDGPVTVVPVATVVTQDAATLVTTATATTLVRGSFTHVQAAVAPDAWARSSDVVREAVYVDDPFELRPLSAEQLASAPTGAPRYLKEHATMSWGADAGQESSFHNVLRVQTRVDKSVEDAKAIDIDFRLCRSIDSRVLWDRRPGGLQLNEGFMKVRPLGGDHWRVTWRKALRFSDRTPDDSGSGTFDFGQMLNYLAPTAVSWWVETETYSLGDRAYETKDEAA